MVLDINPVGIEFAPSELSLEVLISEFKAGVLKTEKRLAFNENDKAFIHLRKYYASALREVFSSDNPLENDEKFVYLSKLGIGIEFKYYVDLIKPRLIKNLNDNFFVDYNHPYLYHSTDSKNSLSYHDTLAEFSSLNVGGWIEEGNDPLKYARNRDMIKNALVKADFFREISWKEEYEERLFKLYGYPTRVLGEKYEKLIKFSPVG